MRVLTVTASRIMPELRATSRVGLPLVAAQLLQMSMGFVDTIMAGNLSAKDLAAVAVGSSLLGPVLVFVIGVLMATNPIVAQLNGAGRYREIGKNLWQSLWLSQLLAIPAFLLVRNLDFVMEWMQIRPEIVPISRGYLRAFSWGFPAAFAYFAVRFFNEGLAHTKPSMYIAVVGVGCNIVGNYAFMYGHFGFPAMGAVGTGLASAVVWWVMFFCMLAFTLLNKKYGAFEIRQGWQLAHWPYLRKILKIGIPNGVSICIEVSMFAVTALIMGSLGVSTVAAHQIALNFAAMTFMIPLGLSIATTARVGFAAGKGDIESARFIGYVGIGMAAAAMCLTAAIMFAIPERIIGIYTDNAEVTKIAVQLLFLAAIFQISDGVQVGAIGALRGLKDTRIPMLFNILAYWLVGLPLGYWLGIFRGMGAPGLWIGLIAGLTVAAILHNVRFYHLSFTRRDTTQNALLADLNSDVAPEPKKSRTSGSDLSAVGPVIPD